MLLLVSYKLAYIVKCPYGIILDMVKQCPMWHWLQIRDPQAIAANAVQSRPWKGWSPFWPGVCRSAHSRNLFLAILQDMTNVALLTCFLSMVLIATFLL